MKQGVYKKEHLSDFDSVDSEHIPETQPLSKSVDSQIIPRITNNTENKSINNWLIHSKYPKLTKKKRKKKEHYNYVDH